MAERGNVLECVQGNEGMVIESQNFLVFQLSLIELSSTDVQISPAWRQNSRAGNTSYKMKVREHH